MLLVWPIAIPLGTAVLCLIAYRSLEAQRALNILGSFALLVASIFLTIRVVSEGPVAAQMGSWPAPFGITLVADILSAAMVLITGIIAVAVAIYGLGDVSRSQERSGHHALTQSLLGGVCGAFVTGDIFNLYVWFEVMLISSFGLLVVGGGKAALDGAVKYVGLNLIATLAFLAGVGLLYGAAGTLNMADLHLTLQGRHGETAVYAAAAMLLFAYGAKAAMFPAFFWLPASYHTPSVTTSALFSALLTKVGVYALIRVFTIVFDVGEPAIQNTLLIGSALTMVVGVLGAAAQMHVRRILSFHIISQIGYMILGLAINTTLGLMGAIFYLFHHIIVKANLFLIAGAIRRSTGSEDLTVIGGLWKRKPWLGVLFLIPALSLAGIPPLSGFWAKLLIIMAALEEQRYIIAFVAVAVGLLTVFSMVKIWLEAFWKAHPGGDDAAAAPAPVTHYLPIIGLALMTVFIGLNAAPFVDAALASANQVLDPTAYVAAVAEASEAAPPSTSSRSRRSRHRSNRSRGRPARKNRRRAQPGRPSNHDLASEALLHPQALLRVSVRPRRQLHPGRGRGGGAGQQDPAADASHSPGNPDGPPDDACRQLHFPDPRHPDGGRGGRGQHPSRARHVCRRQLGTNPGRRPDRPAEARHGGNAMTILGTHDLFGPLAIGVAVCALFLIGALIAATYRLIVGPSLADRVVALDLITMLLVAFLVVFTLASGIRAYIYAAIALALIGFLATVAFARYIERTRGTELEHHD
jgi:multicomponent Na+:H+ antiporter subunit D